MQVYINNTWQQYHNNNTNVTVDLGDSLTVVVRGVGNISMINTSDPRFICETDFACNMELGISDVSNRGVECSLRTPAELSDNGRTLTVILDKVDQINITITGKSYITTQVQWAGFFLPVIFLLKPYSVIILCALFCTVRERPSVIPPATASAEHPQPTSIPAPVITSNIEPTVTSAATTSSSNLVQGSPGQAIPTIPPPPSGQGIPCSNVFIH